jgi:hypothetical protein
MYLVFSFFKTLNDPILATSSTMFENIVHLSRKIHKPCFCSFNSGFLHWCGTQLLTCQAVFSKVKWMDDNEFCIRGPPGVEWIPKVMSYATFTMENVQHIQKIVGGVIYLSLASSNI